MLITAASNDRRSVSGVAVMLGDIAIGWKSSQYAKVCDHDNL